VVGTYSLYVTLGGAHVGTSPVAVQAAAAVGGVDYTKTYAEGDALATAIAGATNAFTINAVDANGVSLGAGGIAFDVTFTPATAGSTTLTIVRKTVGAAGADATDVTRDNADGSYRVTYTPVETGTYALDVKAPGAVAIKGTWPKTVTVYAGVASAATSRPSRTTLFPASAVAGSTITTKIEAFDAKGNARCYDARLFGGDAFTVSVVNAQDAAAGAALEKTAALTPNAAGGYYDVSMTPTIAGSYTVTFKLNGATILEGVKTFTVTHGPLNIANSIVEGVGVYGGVAGVASEAFVYARDAHGNAVTSGLTTADCRAKLNSDASFSAAVSLSASLGRFTVRWTATVPTTSAVATVELRDSGGNWAGAKNSPGAGRPRRPGRPRGHLRRRGHVRRHREGRERKRRRRRRRRHLVARARPAVGRRDARRLRRRRRQRRRHVRGVVRRVGDGHVLARGQARVFARRRVAVQRRGDRGGDVRGGDVRGGNGLARRRGGRLDVCDSTDDDA
jgi:hypothetical protein